MILPSTHRRRKPGRLDVPPLGTYSIIALDAERGELGVAVQSHYFSVGSMAPAAETGVGVSVMQSFPKIAHGSTGMNLMRGGLSAPQALAEFLANDEAPEYRQVAMIDLQRHVAVHTGNRCVAEAGHSSGEYYSCQANMMRHDSVWSAMAQAYERATGPLSRRLLAALRAAQDEGGDLRGCQSAALMVVKAEPTGAAAQDRIIDLRVEDHPSPLKELDRLVALKRAYHHNSRGDALLARKEFDQALAEFAQADALAPHTPELVFWRAVALVNAGRVDEALPLFEEVFREDQAWVLLTRRLTDAELLPRSSELLARILERAPPA